MNHLFVILLTFSSWSHDGCCNSSSHNQKEEKGRGGTQQHLSLLSGKARAFLEFPAVFSLSVCQSHIWGHCCGGWERGQQAGVIAFDHLRQAELLIVRKGGLGSGLEKCRVQREADAAGHVALERMPR